MLEDALREEAPHADVELAAHAVGLADYLAPGSDRRSYVDVPPERPVVIPGVLGRVVDRIRYA